MMEINVQKVWTQIIALPQTRFGHFATKIDRDVKKYRKTIVRNKIHTRRSLRKNTTSVACKPACITKTNLHDLSV